MKKLLLLLPLVLMLSRCGNITNDEIIKEKEFCIKGGMDYKLYCDTVGCWKVVCTKPLSQ